MDTKNDTGEKSTWQIPRLAYLDSLRGLAACWVVFFHLVYLPDPDLPVPTSLWLLKVGGMGVTLFFIISSFSLCLTMPRHIATGRWLLSFYVHRFCRISPLFYLILAITTIFFVSRGVNIKWSDILINFLYFFNFVPGKQESIVMAGWAVGVEVIFYLFFPFIYKVCNTLVKILLLFGLSLIVSYIFKNYIMTTNYFQWSVLRHLPIFIGGMILFYAIQLLHKLTKYRNIVGLSFFVLGVITLLCLQYFPPFLGNSYYNQLFPFGLIMTGLSFAPVTLMVNKFTAFLGKISYSIYLLHPLLIIYFLKYFSAIKSCGIEGGLLYLACAGLTFIILLPIAYVSFLFVENPGINLGKWVTHKTASET